MNRYFEEGSKSFFPGLRVWENVTTAHDSMCLWIMNARNSNTAAHQLTAVSRRGENDEAGERA
jgi:hypothetical protein